MAAIIEQQAEPSPLRVAIAEELFALMGRHRVSQTRLAAVLGMSQPALSKRLNCHQAWTVDELEEVAAYFGEDLTELMLRIAGNPRSVNASLVVPPVQLELPMFALAS